MEKVVIINAGSNFVGELLAAVEEVAGKEKVYLINNSKSVENADVYFFSGRSLKNQFTLKEAFEIISKIIDKPAMYICFGAEALNLYLGGSLKPSSKGIFRFINVRFSGSSYFPDGNYEFFAARHYNIGSLSKKAKGVATSEFGVEAFEYKSSLAVMFHPERSKQQGMALISSFLKKHL